MIGGTGTLEESMFDTRPLTRAAVIPVLLLGSALVAQDAAPTIVTLKGKTFRKWPFETPVPAGDHLRTAMCGSIDGTPVALIDLNNNGRFDDFGRDAISIGNRGSASYISEVLNVRGKLYRTSIPENGGQLEITPYEGPTGKLNLKSGYKSRGHLELAVISSEDGKLSFELSRSAGGELIPVGKYKIAAGLVRRGGESARIHAGNMAPLQIDADESETVEWGTPLVAEFDFSHLGQNVTVEPEIRFFGTLGEEYHAFEPDAKSPKFFVYDKETKKLLATGRFGGC